MNDSPETITLELSAEDAEWLYKLARRTIWNAFVFNDHNFSYEAIPATAKRIANNCGFYSLDTANEFLSGIARQIERVMEASNG